MSVLFDILNASSKMVYGVSYRTNHRRLLLCPPKERLLSEDLAPAREAVSPCSITHRLEPKGKPNRT